MKILFTSVGRRVELLQAFRAAAEKLDIALTVMGADITKSAPALFFCDERRLVCKIQEKEYIPQLLSICEKEKVDCLIPTIDTDLLLLAENKEKFEAIGTKVLISAVDKIKLCRDKNYTADYFVSLGLKSPLPVNSVEKYEEALKRGKVSFPAFIKPKDGSSSINAYKVENLEDLRLYAEKIEDYIIQPFISGREYTIDIFCDYEGNPVYITPRERLAVRSGEVLKSRITQDDTMIAEMRRLIADYRPCGQITVQLIREDVTGDDYYIEINPRFGGGAPLSMKAGADSASAILRMLRGDKLSYIERAAIDGAMGIPVICTNIPGPTDAVHNEETGLIIEKKNAKELRDAILRIYDDPELAKKIGQAGYENVKENYEQKNLFKYILHDRERLVRKARRRTRKR